MTVLSVVLANYNHAHFLPEALDAILSQSVDSMEVLILDDASTDNSIEVIKEYQKRFPQIRLIAREKNGGPIIAANQGIGESKGKYIATCSADDKVLPGFFKECIEMLERFPKAALCTTNFCCFTEGETKKFAERGLIHVKQPCFLEPQDIIKAIKKYDFWIPGNGSIFRKSSLLEAGLLRQDLKALCDWFLNTTVAIRHGICYIPRPLASFRIVKNSYSSKSPQALLYDALFNILEEPQLQDMKKAFFASGMVFQLDKAIFSYIRNKQGLKKYYPRIVIQKLIRKLFRNRYKRMLQEVV
ncbi:MAG: glycosyltransferase family 2 protein [Chlamydiales bacterium]|nr:glycosyltransferase family 2 protein [Chlamydiales bacterium]